MAGSPAPAQRSLRPTSGSTSCWSRRRSGWAVRRCGPAGTSSSCRVPARCLTCAPCPSAGTDEERARRVCRRTRRAPSSPRVHRGRHRGRAVAAALLAPPAGGGERLVLPRRRRGGRGSRALAGARTRARGAADPRPHGGRAHRSDDRWRPRDRCPPRHGARRAPRPCTPRGRSGDRRLRGVRRAERRLPAGAEPRTRRQPGEHRRRAARRAAGRGRPLAHEYLLRVLGLPGARRRLRIPGAAAWARVPARRPDGPTVPCRGGARGARPAPSRRRRPARPWRGAHAARDADRRRRAARRWAPRSVPRARPRTVERGQPRGARPRLVRLGGHTCGAGRADRDESRDPQRDVRGVRGVGGARRGRVRAGPVDDGTAAGPAARPAGVARRGDHLRRSPP